MQTSMTHSNPDIVNITLGIDSVKFGHFELTSHAKEHLESVSFDSYEFQFDLQSIIEDDVKLFRVLLKVTLYEKMSSQSKIELAHIQTENAFRVQNFNEVFLKQNDKYSIPDQLIIVTAGISVSTARGMLAMCIKDTVLSDAVIPIIDPKVFIHQAHIH
jgi:hypothetical protein